MSGKGNIGLPFGEGAIAGAVAWVLGVVATFVSFQLDVHGRLYTTGFSQIEAPVAGSIWFHFIFHDAFIGRGILVSNLTPFMLVPIVMLLAGGFYVANRGQTESVQDGFTRGATVTLGYAALLVVSWLLIVGRWGETPLHMGFHPEGLPVMLVMGLAYPVVFGGIGGILASQV